MPIVHTMPFILSDNANYAFNAIYALHAMPNVQTMPFLQQTQCQLGKGAGKKTYFLWSFAKPPLEIESMIAKTNFTLGPIKFFFFCQVLMVYFFH